MSRLRKVHINLFHFDVSEVFLLDTLKTGFRYCEVKSKSTYTSFFEIFGRPFDQVTWVCISVSLFAIFIYFGKTSLSLVDSLFAIIKLVLQRSASQKHSFSLYFVVAFFFLEFFFLSSATEKMIAPIKPYIMQTLSELFSRGYKLMDFVPLNFYANDVTTEQIREAENNQWLFQREEYQDYLMKEGIESFSKAPDGEFYKWVWDRDVHRNYNGSFAKSVCYDPGNQKLVTMSVHYGAQNYKENILQDPCGDITCHTISKRYGHQYEIIEVHSKIRSLVKRIFSRVLHDSGIHNFWNRIDSRLNEKKLYSFQENRKVVAIQMKDLRFLYIISASVSLLGMACACFCFEKLPKVWSQHKIFYKNLLTRFVKLFRFVKTTKTTPF